MRKLFPFLLILILAASSCEQEIELHTEASQTLRKAATFLWGKQAEDGGWHSETHGILKTGQVCTPYVLDALMQIPDSIYSPEQELIRKALDFIKSRTHKNGALGFYDSDLLEYPNYATAFGLKCLSLYGNEGDMKAQEKMRDYLLAQQFDEDRDYQQTHSVYGGWGFGEEYLTPGNPGHVDISHSRRILEALEANGALDSETKSKAMIFLMRLQKNPGQMAPEEGLLAAFDSITYDGGFIYSPVQEDVNKGGWVNNGKEILYMRSYATATCDGILASQCLEGAEEMIAEAREWLQGHSEWGAPEGIPKDHPQQWHQVMFYYHLSVRAQAYDKLNWEGDWQSLMLDELRGKQAQDGSFSNPDGAANKENDPLLATAMVVRALSAGL